MIPLRDVIPSRTVPGVVLALMAVNAVAFGYGQWLGPDRDILLQRFALVAAHYSPFALFTSMFLHASLAHVAVNVVFLGIFGPTVEDRIGHLRFAGFYFLCGAGAAIAHVVLRPESGTPLVGASGAIGGLIGAYFVLFPRSKIVTVVPLVLVQFVEVPAVFFLGLWLLLQLTLGMGPFGGAGPASHGVWTQAAGFATGAAAIVLLKRPERLRVEWWDTHR